MSPHYASIRRGLRRATLAGALAAVAAILGAWSGPTAATTPSGFNIVPSPIIPGATLLAVSASGPNDAWAVGANDSGALAEHWNGTSWTQVPTPDSDGQSLGAVDDVSPKLAWAVGSQILRWNGNTWAVVGTPAGDGSLDGVSGFADGQAWAAGSDQDDVSWVAMKGSNKGWKQINAVQGSGDYAGYLNGVTAITPSDIWMTGDIVNGGGVLAGEADAVGYNGKTWTTVRLGGPEPDVQAIASNGATNVWAVGTWSRDGRQGATGPDQPAVWHLRPDGTWKFTKPIPTHYTTDHELRSVAVLGAKDVWAVGDRTTAADAYRTLILHWDGTAWTDLGGPNAGSGDNLLWDVTAVPGTTSEEWAVGRGSGDPLILQHP